MSSRRGTNWPLFAAAAVLLVALGFVTHFTCETEAPQKERVPWKPVADKTVAAAVARIAGESLGTRALPEVVSSLVNFGGIHEKMS